MRTHLVLAAFTVGCATVEPELNAVSPDLLCDELPGGTVITLEGARFTSAVTDTVHDGGQLRPPEVWFHPRGPLGTGAELTVDHPVSAPANRVIPHGDSQLEVRIDGGVGLASGVWDVEVRNPDQRGDVLEGALTVVGPPDALRMFPAGVCQIAPTWEVTVVGENFLRLDGAEPTVLVKGEPVEIVRFDNCLPLADGRDGEVCRGIRIKVAPNTMPLGAVTVDVTNPEPAACASETIELEIVRPATITDVEPSQVCQADDSFDLYGTNLMEGTRVYVGDYRAEVIAIDRTHLEVHPDPRTPPGVYDLDVRPAQGCPVVVEDAITVHSRPVIFDVDPPLVWAGNETEVLVRVSDVVEEVSGVWLTDSAGTRIDVSWRWDEATPGDVRLMVPRAMPTDEYEVHVAQKGSCSAESAATVEVANRRGISIDAVEPSFAWSYAPTPVVITAAPPEEREEWLNGLEGPPRFWLLGPDGDGTATRVLGVDPRSVDEVTAILPAGLAPGLYNLFATNEAGQMGVLQGAVKVTDHMPPFIEGVAPATLPNRSDARMTINGRGFRDATVELRCREPDGTIVPVEGTIIEDGWGQLEVSVPADRFHRAVCLVHLENGDGTAYEWAAVSITNPAQNLFPWQEGPMLVEARRALAMGAGRTTGVSRWAYAIGGDSGTDDTPLETIEVARVGVYGDLDPWVTLPRNLPEARTRAGTVRIKNYLYLIGGYDGTRAVRSLYRAQILDPVKVPIIERMDVISTDGGLPAGRYHYRVSAMYRSNDPDNPKGETLPSEVFSVTLPEGTSPTLTWSEVSGVNGGYRIYRTPYPDMEPSEVELLAYVGDPVYTDNGSRKTNGWAPLPQGSLGNWAKLPDMSFDRASPCVAVAHDPFPDPERYYIYAAGGFDAGRRVLDRVEVIDVEIRSNGKQIMGTWRDAGVRLSEPRYECGGYVVQSGLHTVVDPEEAWVFFVGGRDHTKTLGNVDTGRVGTLGALMEWDTISPIREPRAGFGVLSASDFLYAFGGSQSRPSKTGASANLAYFPEVQNWNSLSTSMSRWRYLTSAAQESAVVVVGGGSTTDETASRFVDWTNW